MPDIRLPDGAVRHFDAPVSVAEVAASIGPGLAKAALAGKVDGKLVDTSYRIDRDADVAIVTDDNPRSEDPAAIRAAILAACPGGIEIGDRARAIEAGLSALRPGDVLVVAGKGHEQGQTIAGTVHPFDDVATVRALAAGA